MRTVSMMLVAGGLAAVALPVGAADSPQFRGADGNGLSATKLPAVWEPDKNVKWKADVPGVAWSCPIVVGDKVIVTSAFSKGQAKPKSGFGGGRGGRGAALPSYQFTVRCLDRKTGATLWEALAHEGVPPQPTHGSNTFASETPASDGERVYAFFGNVGLYCFDLAGKPVWKKDTGAYPMQNGWGTSSSPVVHGGKVYVQSDNEQSSFLAAFDAKTGGEVWRKERAEKSGWSTPYLWTAAGRTDLVVIGGQKVRGYDPATGAAVWELAVGGGQSSASPASDGEHLYVGVGQGGGGGGRGGRPGGGGPPGGAPGGGGRGGAGAAGTLFAVKAGATGDITPKAGATSSAGVAWGVPKVWPAAASPLAYMGKVYLLDRQGGMVSCFDAKTGAADYARERIPQAKAFWASPWGADGKVFCLDESGATYVLKAGKDFEVVGVNKLGGEELFWATPAASDGQLFIRGVDRLYCIE
jgi:outer membrane protein assembly factor BamB